LTAQLEVSQSRKPGPAGNDRSWREEKLLILVRFDLFSILLSSVFPLHRRTLYWLAAMAAAMRWMETSL
jgi:hypothetical protein